MPRRRLHKQSLFTKNERINEHVSYTKRTPYPEEQMHRKKGEGPTAQQASTPDGGPNTSTGTETVPEKADQDTQTGENTEPALPLVDEEGDLLLATCAEHLRHVARTSQQLMAALAVHVDAIRTKQPTRAPTTPSDQSIEDDC